MLERRGDHMVVRRDESENCEVEGFSPVAGEDQSFGVFCVDEGCKLFTRLKDYARCFYGKWMAASSRISTDVGHKMNERLESLIRLWIRCSCVVEVYH